MKNKLLIFLLQILVTINLKASLIKPSYVGGIALGGFIANKFYGAFEDHRDYSKFKHYSFIGAGMYIGLSTAKYFYCRNFKLKK